MAKADILFEFILSTEGGYVNHPNDAGGPTNKGVTLETFKQSGRDINGDGKIDIEDLKLISNEDTYKIFKSEYWDKCKGDEINSQSVANILVDWAYNSGVRIAVKHLQSILGVQQDGILGPATLAAINQKEPRILFNCLKQLRVDYYNSIVEKRPSQKCFYNGWINRITKIEFSKLKCFDNKIIVFKDDGCRI